MSCAGNTLSFIRPPVQPSLPTTFLFYSLPPGAGGGFAWEEASAACKAVGARLVSIADPQDDISLLTTMNSNVRLPQAAIDSGLLQMWIGLQYGASQVRALHP